MTGSLRADWLGRLLRRLREDQGLTLKFVAAHLGVDFSVLSRMERGEASLTRDHVVGLLDAYRVFDARERVALVGLAQQVWQSRGQLDFDGAIADDGFGDLLWLESNACQIQCYSPTSVPDLLHSAELAEFTALASLGETASPEQMAARLRLAEQRQQVLWREPEPPNVIFVLDEPVLRRPNDDTQAWRHQLDHLAKIVAAPNVTLRVLTNDKGRPADVDHGFTVFTLPPPYPGPVVHIPYLGGRLLLEEHADRYLTAFDHLDRAAVDGGAFISNLNGSIKEG